MSSGEGSEEGEGSGQEKGNGQGEEGEGSDPALDFLSPLFDPVKALQCSPSKLSLPHPTVQPCDNLHTYTSVVEGRRQQPAPPPCPSPPPLTPAQGGIIKQKRKKKTVFDFMEKGEPGPFAVLQACRREGGRVRVTIRHCTGVRGVCEGTLLLYDKHLNLVLSQVQEWCNPFRTHTNGGLTLTKRARRRRERREKEGGGEGSVEEGKEEGSVEGNGSSGGAGVVVSTANPRDQKWEVCRTVQQLFVRGDNIIHVTPVAETASKP